MKHCSKCNELKPLAEFGLRCLNGRPRSRCRACEREIGNTRYHANPSEEIANNKTYRNANRDKINARRRAYQSANRSWLLPIKRDYAQQNKEKLRQLNRRWQQSHGAIIVARVSARRALKTARTTDNPARIEAFYLFVKTTPSLICVWCRTEVPINNREVDHIIPLSKGGEHCVANLCCACKTCNRRKGALLPSDLLIGTEKLHGVS